ncbi:MAG: hypothetical protein PGN11_22130 [Quadrisphaera sp.]
MTTPSSSSISQSVWRVHRWAWVTAPAGAAWLRGRVLVVPGLGEVAPSG